MPLGTSACSHTEVALAIHAPLGHTAQRGRRVVVAVVFRHSASALSSSAFASVNDPTKHTTRSPTYGPPSRSIARLEMSSRILSNNSSYPRKCRDDLVDLPVRFFGPKWLTAQYDFESNWWTQPYVFRGLP